MRCDYCGQVYKYSQHQKCPSCGAPAKDMPQETNFQQPNYPDNWEQMRHEALNQRKDRTASEAKIGKALLIGMIVVMALAIVPVLVIAAWSILSILFSSFSRVF